MLFKNVQSKDFKLKSLSYKKYLCKVDIPDNPKDSLYIINLCLCLRRSSLNASSGCPDPITPHFCSVGRVPSQWWTLRRQGWRKGKPSSANPPQNSASRNAAPSPRSENRISLFTQAFLRINGIIWHLTREACQWTKTWSNTAHLGGPDLSLWLKQDASLTQATKITTMRQKRSESNPHNCNGAQKYLAAVAKYFFMEVKERCVRVGLLRWRWHQIYGSPMVQSMKEQQMRANPVRSWCFDRRDTGRPLW